MRPIWKGHITFGLVSVPVTLYPAEQRSDLQLHLVDSRNLSRVRYERVNSETGEEVPWDKIVKGYEYSDGNYVLLGDEELKRAAPEATKAVEIEAFVDLDEIDPMYFDKPYYLEPAKGGAKGYVLLREVLKETGKVGIARVVIRTRQYLAAMSPRGDALVLTLMRYPQELRSIEELDLPSGSGESGLKKPELAMARTLVESMSTEWDPESYHDEYRESLMKWIQQKIETGETERVSEVEEEEEAPVSFNIMDALKKSVEAAGKGKSSGKKSASSKSSKKKPAQKKTRRKTG